MRKLTAICAALVFIGGVVGCGSSKHKMSTMHTPVSRSEAPSTQEALNQVAKETQTADQEINEGAERLRQEKQSREEEERYQQDQSHQLGSACKNGESGSSACAEELKQCEATPSCSSELAKAEEDREREADTAKIMSKAEERYNKRQDELMERERQKDPTRP